MQKINQLINISLERLSFGSKLQTIEEFIVNNQITIKILTDINNISIDENSKRGECRFSFAIMFVNDNNDDKIVLSEENFEELDTIFKLIYSIDFELTSDGLDYTNDEFNNEILSIIEPFLREEMAFCINKSKLSLPPLPYNFWKHN